MFIFITFIILFTGLCTITAAQTPGASAGATDVSVGCFSGDSLVMLTNGEQKQIGYLKTGDEILSVNHLKVIPSEMFIMLDKEPSKQGIHSK
jgi:hypothetical protein